MASAVFPRPLSRPNPIASSPDVMPPPVSASSVSVSSVTGYSASICSWGGSTGSDFGASSSVTTAAVVAVDVVGIGGEVTVISSCVSGRNASSPDIVSSVSGFSSGSSSTGASCPRLSSPEGADSMTVVALRSGDAFGDVGDVISVAHFYGGNCKCTLSDEKAESTCFPPLTTLCAVCVTLFSMFRPLSSSSNSSWLCSLAYCYSSSRLVAVFA